MRRKCQWAVCFAALMVVGCSKGKENNMAEKKESPKGTALSVPTQASVDPSKNYTVIIKTNKGDIKVKLYVNEAPLSVTNFVNLAQKGFYKGLTFHRVVSGFVIQGGDPTGTGRGGPGYTLPAEIKLPHKEGALAWARLPDTDPNGKPVNPKKESSGSQFYITLAPQPALDGEYTVFGQTTEGMEVVKQIQRGDVMQDVTISVD